MPVPDIVFDTIDGKSAIYTVQPKPPYNVGDLYFTGKEILVCKSGRENGDYSESDWEKKDYYTDDSALNNFITGDYSENLEATNTRLTRAETSISNNSNEISLKASTESLTELANKANQTDKALSDAQMLIQKNMDAIAVLTSRDFKVEFTTIIEQIKKVNGDLISYKNEVGNWMRFDADGNLVLGATRVAGQDAYELKLKKNRISFMVNDEEGAYISNIQLYILNAVVVQNLRIGYFEWVTHGIGNLGLVLR